MSTVKFKKSGIVYVGPKQGNNVGIYSVTINHERNRIYIGSVHTPTIAVIDGNTHKFVKTIRVCQKEYHFFADIGWNPVYEKLYLSSNQFNTVWVLDGKTEKVTKELKIGNHPAGIAVDESTGMVYIAVGESGEVVVLDGETDKEISRIKVESWAYPVAVDSKNKLAFVVCQLDNLARYQNFEDPYPFRPGILCIIDTNKNKVIQKVEVGRRSRGVAVNPNLGKVYVANRSDDTVHVIDEKSGKTKEIIRTQCNPWGIAVNPNNNKVYAVNLLGEWYDNHGQSATVTVIDGKKDTILKHIPVGKITCHIAINPKTNLAYTADEDNAQVSVIDCDKDEVIRIVDGIGLTIDEISINPKTKKVYIPSHFFEGTIVVDAQKKEVEAKIKHYGWVTSAGVNPATNKIYVSNQEDGYVDVIDGRSNKIIDKINLGVGTNLMHRLWPVVKVDTKRNRVFVILTRFCGVAVIDGKKDLLMKRIQLGPLNNQDPGQFAGSCEFGIAINEWTNRIYVNDPVNRCLSIIDGEALEVIEQIDLWELELPLSRQGDPGYLRKNSPFDHLRIDEVNDRVYAYTWILDGESGAIIGRIPPQYGTGVTCIDSKRNHIYVHGWNGLTVIDLRTLEKVGFLPMKSVPGGNDELRMRFAVDPENRRVYAVKNLMVDGEKLHVYDIK